jgi:uncharacterized protein (TIRG00374 family)
MTKIAGGDERSATRNRGIPDGVRFLLPRTIGLILLIVLLQRMDVSHLLDTLKNADIGMVSFAMIMLIVLIGIKTLRWRMILRTLQISMSWRNAFLAYFASIFIGFLTPGRLGEFGRALYLRDDPNAKSGAGFSSVLADRLFDLYALLLIGSAAIFSLGGRQYWLWTGLFFLVSLFPLVLFLHDVSFNWLKTFAGRLGRVGTRLFDPNGWLVGMRYGLLQMGKGILIVSTVLTVTAYLVYFTQCFLLSMALAIEVSFVSVMFAVALGSLVTLLPFSISGLGTREATIIAYMSTVGISAETALSFSFLVFVTFYVVCGLIGAMAWFVHPIQLDLKRGEIDRE